MAIQYLLFVLFIYNQSYTIAVSFLATQEISEKQGQYGSLGASAETLNQYVDQMCKNINKKINDAALKLPFSFQEFSTDDYYTSLFSPLVAFRLWNGTISNIATFQRGSEANIIYINKSLIFSTTLKLDSLAFEYDAEMKLAGFGPSKHISRTLEGFTANVTLSVDATTLTVYLNSLEVSHTGTKIKDAKGSSDSDMFANEILNYAEFYLEDRFNKDLKGILNRAIRENLKSINSL